jgi:hypothetical protein
MGRRSLTSWAAIDSCINVESYFPVKIHSMSEIQWRDARWSEVSNEGGRIWKEFLSLVLRRYSFILLQRQKDYEELVMLANQRVEI